MTRKHTPQSAAAEVAEALPAPDPFEARHTHSPLPPLAVVRALTPATLEAAERVLGAGYWPRELPDQLGVPRRLWGQWLRVGARDLHDGVESSEAALYSLVTRASQRLQVGYRGAVERLASARLAWSAAAWLLRHLAPGQYSDPTESAVDAEVGRLLKVARETLTPETYEALTTALEAARGQ